MAKNQGLGDPKDIYVRSENKTSLKKLGELFKGVAGCSFKHLQARCAAEKWVQKRETYWAKVNAKAAEKSVEIMAIKKVRTLEDLNESAYKRTEQLLKVNEQVLKDGIELQEDGTVKIKLTAKEIRTLQTNIADLQHELRLYSNFHPDRPVESVDDNSDDDALIEELFGDLFDGFEEGQADG